MKRDMDLIREILLVTESEGDYKSSNGYPDEQVAYHVQLLLDARLIEGKVLSQNPAGLQIPSACFIPRLTMSGHDFLDASREFKVWEKAKGAFKEEGVGWTVDMLKAVCIQIVKARLGLP